MNSFFDLEQRVIQHSQELVAAAAAQRLADQVQRPAWSLRARLAAALYALAARLDSSVTPVPARAAPSVPLNGTVC